MRACRDEGLDAIVAVSDADQDSLAARLATDVVHIGPPSPAQSYLRVEQIVAGALLASCDAVHPGYGFLSERAELAESCAANGLVFVGPSAETIRRGGDKVEARRIARAAGVPTGAGSDAVRDADAAMAIAGEVGYPVLLKAAAGGGGRGMVRVDGPAELAARFRTASAEADAAFGDGRIYVERYIENARHVEVQLIGDQHGAIVHLGDRDCSTQRRFQKLVEEAPATALSSELRDHLADAAVAVGRELDYYGAGTVEFLVDLDRHEFSFLEVNTRVQVEHPVTEVITGIDIVREQLRIAGGEPLAFGQDDVSIRGHAIECRINAESVADGFVPSPGTITRWDPPGGDHVRVDTHAFTGYEVPPYYDSLVAKLIVSGADRTDAITSTLHALDAFAIEGIDTTRDLHRAVLTHDDFRRDAINTRW
ncbi:MAG TPA: biotin carboxylase N-terminal domain-containing protein, partial [Ilumatobacteraceae bacterium]|nr:biotin carboxylase N-terminal domain-containing protein [Ilumatobacteraceae bacterium]